MRFHRTKRHQSMQRRCEESFRPHQVFTFVMAYGKVEPRAQPFTRHKPFNAWQLHCRDWACIYRIPHENKDCYDMMQVRPTLVHSRHCSACMSANLAQLHRTAPVPAGQVHHTLTSQTKLKNLWLVLQLFMGQLSTPWYRPASQQRLAFLRHRS